MTKGSNFGGLTMNDMDCLREFTDESLNSDERERTWDGHFGLDQLKLSDPSYTWDIANCIVHD